ncbi:MAG: hypothetical protein ACFFCZ_31500 [Promethearchaeota archaeon]
MPRSPSIFNRKKKAYLRLNKVEELAISLIIDKAKEKGEELTLAEILQEGIKLYFSKERYGVGPFFQQEEWTKELVELANEWLRASNDPKIFLEGRKI